MSAMDRNSETQPLRRAVAYARVSSKEQEREGFSIAAQRKIIGEYAAQNGFKIDAEFTDVETAKQAGRANFEEMIKLLRRSPSVRVVLVEKTDRLYRNFRDYVILEDLDIEIHLVKEGEILSRDARSSTKFMHGIKVLMAKNYIDNLSEEARKGMQEKAEQGIWPTVAPIGYRNVLGPDGKRIIEVDDKAAPVVAHMFGWYASGTLSVKDLTAKVHEAGLVHPRTGKHISGATIHAMLRHRIYTGEYEWRGRRYKGKHQPIITHELFDRVQGVLDGRHSKKTKKGKKAFAFAGLMSCGHCGCAMVGEIKKQRYTYYHCSGFKGKCGEPYVREEVVEQKFYDLLGQAKLPPERLKWLTKALADSHIDEQKEHEEAVGRLKAEYDSLQKRLHTLYGDKLDGRIDRDVFDTFAADCRAKQDACMRAIERHQAADENYMQEGIRLLELAGGAQKFFRQQSASEKRELLEFVLSNSVWRNGTLTGTFRKPFDMIAETAMLAAEENAGEGDFSAGHMVWLLGPDSNQRPTG
jgi:site-specific DNA recombinase